MKTKELYRKTRQQVDLTSPLYYRVMSEVETPSSILGRGYRVGRDSGQEHVPCTGGSSVEVLRERLFRGPRVCFSVTVNQLKEVTYPILYLLH